MKIEPPPDLVNMTQANDFWLTSMNEQDAWEAMRLECKAENERSREDGR